MPEVCPSPMDYAWCSREAFWWRNIQHLPTACSSSNTNHKNRTFWWVKSGGLTYKSPALTPGLALLRLAWRTRSASCPNSWRSTKWFQSVFQYLQLSIAKCYKTWSHNLIRPSKRLILNHLIARYWGTTIVKFTKQPRISVKASSISWPTLFCSTIQSRQSIKVYLSMRWDIRNGLASLFNKFVVMYERRF